MTDNPKSNPSEQRDKPRSGALTPAWLQRKGGITLAIIAALCVPLVGIVPGDVTFALYCLIAGTGLALLAPEQKKFWAIVVSVSVIAFLPLVANQLIRIKTDTCADRMKQSTYAVQLALERYAADIGTYPLSLQPLRDEAYLPSFPHNDYLYGADIDWRHLSDDDSKWQYMYEVGTDYLELGHEPELAGNVVYIPHIQKDLASEVVVDDYLLIVFLDTQKLNDWVNGSQMANTDIFILASKKTPAESAPALATPGSG